MGFLSKLLKKAKPLLPLAMTMFAPQLAAFGGSLPGAGIFSAMNPMAKNMLMQGALGYGTAALTGSRHPERAAMWSGLASLPFSYMGASQAAGDFNKRYAGVPGVEEIMKPGKPIWDVAGPAGHGSVYKGLSPETFAGYRNIPGSEISKLTPWDVIKGAKTKAEKMITLPSYESATPTRFVPRPGEAGQGDWYGEMIKGREIPFPESDFYSKISKGGVNRWTGAEMKPGEVVSDWMPTIASQAAGLYGGRMTDEEKWEASKKKRLMELAFMYGVDPSEIEGEMDNPFYTEGDLIGGFGLKNGGITSLQNGGDVNGPGTGTSDSINANLSDGEFVMTAKAVENLGGGDRYAGARQMYDLMNVLDPESETMSEVV